MRKNLLVFCCVTLLTTFLFGCNGIPALAASNKINVNSVEVKNDDNTLRKTLTEKTVAKKKNSKKKSKKKKARKVVKVENYIKNGKFKYVAYGKAIGADDTIYVTNHKNLDYIVGECFIEISTNLQRDDAYYVAIGFLNKERTVEKPTYLIIFEEWGKSVEIEDGVCVSMDGLKKLDKVLKYMIKHPDPYSAPEIEGLGEWGDDAADIIR